MVSTPTAGVLLAFAALAALSSASNAEGEAFLKANKDKEGVVTLASGLQYKVLAAGDGDSHPTKASPCTVHYEGRTVANYPDGKVFDSSYARGTPAKFAPNQVIKGWTEAMQKMVEGDKWELYIPSDLAYGDNGRPPKIMGGDVLIFTMEIIEINGPKVPKEGKKDEIESLDASAGFHAAGHARNHLTQHSSSCACTMSMSRTTVAGKAVIARHVQHLRRRSRDQAHTACMLEVPVTGHKVVTQRKPKRSERRTLPRARPKSNQVPTRAAVTATAGRRTSPARCELRRVCRHSVRDTRAVKN
eukprot:CAMPEP_0185192250 /NCGR_PEP_ID=MMETSP1140-20130426/17829_1 /TAXON_ID=298111 /ORGANISM="Pavlova sp., Strain CCMP459" /LENGTH=301 /DNA_ID=CAMNT_0027758987 /DNA_START=26 /DNA_END=932 /DNA_ORIENTATION=+